MWVRLVVMEMKEDFAVGKTKGLQLLWTDATIRKFSPFFKRLGNSNEGIVSPG